MPITYYFVYTKTFSGSSLYFHPLIFFFNHSEMKHWGQCDLQDIVVDELKIKTEKSQVIFLTFKKLLNTDILKFVCIAT